MRGRDNQVFKLNTSTMEMANSYVLTKRMKVALISLILCIFIPSYNYILNEILQLDLGRGSISGISYLLLAIIGLFSYTFVLRVNRKLMTLMCLVLAGMFVSYLIYPEIRDAFIDKDYNPLTSSLLYLPLIAFPMMVLTNYLRNHLILLFEYVRIPSLTLIILSFFDYYWTVILNGHYFDVNYMSFSYFMLPATCLSFAYGLMRGKILDIIAAVAGLLVILVVGSRGCFVCGVIFIVMASINRYSLSLDKMLRIFVVFVTVVIALSYTFTSFSDNVQSFMYEHGASSRTLMKISEGTFEESGSRDDIYKLMRDAIADNPIGYGLMGDRYILSQHNNKGYCHSVFYEFLVDYGVILGPILLLYLIGSLFIKFKKYIKLDIYYILAFFVVTGFVKLFFSGSYLGEAYFWGMIGILMNNNKILSKVSNENQN